LKPTGDFVPQGVRSQLDLVLHSLDQTFRQGGEGRA
jgi:hypothetical protein